MLNDLFFLCVIPGLVILIGGLTIIRIVRVVQYGECFFPSINFNFSWFKQRKQLKKIKSLDTKRIDASTMRELLMLTGEKDIYPDYWDFVPDEIKALRKNGFYKNYLQYPKYFIVNKKIYPISIDGKRVLLTSKLLAEDAPNLEAYLFKQAEAIKEKENDLRAKAADQRNEFNSLVQEVYEDYKFEAAQIPPEFANMTADEKLAFLRNLAADTDNNQEIELTITPWKNDKKFSEIQEAVEALRK